jgi:predicted CXXCH cytochrome family protein
VRRLALLFAAGTLWLFLAAIPAFADGGPHVASVNSGVSTLTADGCAGCHRAHTAQGEGLLVESNEQALCESCHGATAVGAATDVMTGVQYVKGTIDSGDKSDDPVLGYLRDGGFKQAHLGSSDGELTRVGYYRATDTVSFRMKVPADATAEDVTSAHLDLDGATGVTAKETMWGNGLANAQEPIVDLECAACHNPHGNGQYRILNKFNATDQIVQSTQVGITRVAASTNRFFTAEAHSLVVGDIVTISGVTGATPSFSTAAQYIVKAVAGNTFTVALTSATPTTADVANAVVDVTADGTGGTVKRWASIVDDAPVPASATDNRNYTVMQVKGTQGTNNTFLLYESNVLAARTAGTFAGFAGDYSATGGDYFHRTVPWNPAVNNPASNCNTTNGTLPAACGVQNDAPNGRPATITTAGSGAVAFNDQISAWCSTCHTRYYSSTNTNPGIYENDPSKLEPSSSADAAKNITGAAGNTITVSGTSVGYSVGDIVRFSADATNSYYVLSTSGATFTVSATLDGTVVAAPAATGTVIRLYPFSSSSWYFARNGSDDAYKFQHQTTTNRACVTCHVGHGSDAVSTGAQSGAVPYPDSATAVDPAYNSRLLKIDNRGTCQACHDPTGTATAGQQLGNPATPTVP